MMAVFCTCMNICIHMHKLYVASQLVDRQSKTWDVMHWMTFSPVLEDFMGQALRKQQPSFLYQFIIFNTRLMP